MKIIFILMALSFLSGPFVYGQALSPQNFDASIQGSDVYLTWEMPGAKTQILLSESFEGTSFPPAGWINLDMDGDQNSWILFNVAYNQDYNPYPAFEGNNAAASYSWYNGTTLTPNNWLITPTISIDSAARLSFALAVQRPNYADEHLQIRVSENGINPDDFSQIIFDENLNSGFYSWQLRKIDLSAYDGKNIHLAFIHNASTDMFALKIDQILISQGETAPLSGFNIFRDGISIAEIADPMQRNYQDINPVPGSHIYKITALYGSETSDFSAEDTVILPWYTDPNFFSAVVNQNEVHLEWNIQTTIGNVPFFAEGFEQCNVDNFPPLAWTNADIDNDSEKWILFDVPYNSEINPYPAAEGIHCTASYSWFNGTVLTPNNWLISPPLLVPMACKLYFSLAAQRPNYATERFKIKISEQTNHISDFYATIFDSTMQNGNIEWKNTCTDLSAYAGKLVYLAFVHQNSTNQFAIKLDDLKMKTSSVLDLYSYNIYRNNILIKQITDTSVVSFVDNPGPGIYIYKMVPVYGATDYLAIPSVTVTLNPSAIPEQLAFKPHIFPNPAHDYIYIDLPDTYNSLVEIINIQGKLMFYNEFANTKTIKISFSDFPKGVYIIRTQFNHNRFIEKICVY